mmetsp:Transcript_8709/g.12758  ORF Transcript_8709/g.12758 Transcript_8709/m.12758 type:complete len:112 (+) Transcript_8709:1-336(+)
MCILFQSAFLERGEGHTVEGLCIYIRASGGSLHALYVRRYAVFVCECLFTHTYTRTLPPTHTQNTHTHSLHTHAQYLNTAARPWSLHQPTFLYSPKIVCFAKEYNQKDFSF